MDLHAQSLHRAYLWKRYVLRRARKRPRAASIEIESMKICVRVHFAHILYKPNLYSAYNAKFATIQTRTQINPLKAVSGLLLECGLSGSSSRILLGGNK